MRNSTLSNDAKRGENAVFVTEGDNMYGFYAARACLSSREFQKVVVGVSDKKSDFAKALEKEGALVKEYDLENKNSIRHCLQGVSCVALVPRASYGMVEAARNVLDAIEQENQMSDKNEVSVKKLVLWSCFIVAAEEERHAKDHKNVTRLFYDIERLVKKCSVENWTICRIGFALQVMFIISEAIQNNGMLPLATDKGEFSPVDLKDCARAVTNILLGFDSDNNKKNKHRKDKNGSRRSAFGRGDDSNNDNDKNGDNDNDEDDFNQQTLTFTGHSLMNGEKFTERANRALQDASPLHFDPVSQEDMRKILESEADRDLSTFQIDALLNIMELIKNDKLAFRCNDLKKVLKGREPTSVEKFFEENSDMFKPRGGHRVSSIARDY